MPSFQDSAFIFFLALLLFGPKKLPELARQVGKLMGEFRRASNEFRMQMEDELRMAEQAEKQKQIEAIEAAAPVTPAIESSNSIAAPSADAEAQRIAESIPDPLSDHPHMPPAEFTHDPAVAAAAEPTPIASSGDLDLMPPSTGLPVGRSGVSEDLSPVLESIPHASFSEPEPPSRYLSATDPSASHASGSEELSQTLNQDLAPEAHTHG